MDSAAVEYYRQCESEAERECLLSDPVYQRFRYVCFVSRSKGRGRKRKHWQEVELVRDCWNGVNYREFARYPWDRIASEMYPQAADDIEAEKRLVNRVREIC